MICDDISIIFEALLKKIHQNGIELPQDRNRQFEIERKEKYNW